MQTFALPRLLFTLLLGLILAQPQTASAQFGVAAGFNFEQLNDIELDEGSSAFENRTGWHVAAWFELPLGSLALRPGVRYLDAGALYRGLDENDGTLEDDFAVQMLEIPLDVRYRFGGGDLTPYIVGGPVLRFPIVSDDELN
ncbi:MAG TPA: outer membrane beta-barrel protein, partial [Rhodothermales bacterium]|nr:outer membrane beta-barrel protein [Rhodothermales bacterium]